MQTVTYSETLKRHFKLLDMAVKELSKEEVSKTVDQFYSEVDSVKQILDEVKLLGIDLYQEQGKLK